MSKYLDDFKNLMITSRFTFRLRELCSGNFARNVATVATGTALAQVIGIMFAPVLARMYGPEAFGLQGVFASFAGTLTVIASLGYPTAIVLPARNSNAVNIAALSIVAAALFSALCAVVLYKFGDN